MSRITALITVGTPARGAWTLPRIDAMTSFRDGSFASSASLDPSKTWCSSTQTFRESLLCFSENFWMILAGTTGSSKANATPVGQASFPYTPSYPVTCSSAFCISVFFTTL